MEEKIDNLSNALMAMQNIMVQSGMVTNEKKEKNSAGSSKGENSALNTNSEMTIYQNAVQKDDNETIEVDGGEVILNISKNKSFVNQSSDEQGDTSDELINVNVTEQFRSIADCAAEMVEQEMVEERRPNPELLEVENRIRDAEAAKMRIIATPGNDFDIVGQPVSRENTHAMVNSIDDQYLVIGANVDPSLRQKIFRHEYIDFAWLLPKDRVVKEDDHCMELVNKGGYTYFVPVSDRECTSSISSFSCWEQAFRVFSNVYTKIFPDCATQLIQYNHIIYLASQNFVWENVYWYDKEFRMHLANFPERSWAVILQQAWLICLRDRIRQFGLAELCSVKYQDIDCAVQTCLKVKQFKLNNFSLFLTEDKQGNKYIFLGKSDIKSAFHLMPLSRSSFLWLIMKARHPLTGKWVYFVDKCLPFGSSISCAHFQRFSDALKQHSIQNGLQFNQ